MIEDCGTVYRQAGDHIKKLLNQTIFSRLLVGEDGYVEPEFSRTFDMLTSIATIVKTEQNECGQAENKNLTTDNAKAREHQSATGFLSLTSNHLLYFFGQGWTKDFLEQMTGIEPASSAWEADILPMNYICVCFSIAQKHI